MEKYNFTDLTPEETKLDMVLCGELVFRRATIADEAWIKRMWGQEVEKIFVEQNFQELFKIFWRLLSQESKEKVLKIKFENDEGKLITGEQMGGHVAIGHCISGVKEKMDVLNAVMRSFGFEKVAKEVAEIEKKKIMESNLTTVNS